MTETPEPEPDIPTQLREIGKKCLKIISKGLDFPLEEDDEKDDLEIEEAPPVRRARKRVDKLRPKPKTRNLGIRGWLKGTKVEERKVSR